MSQQPLPIAEPTAAEVLVRDPLSPVTRKERLYLLAVSMIGIAMVRTGLVPSKIATFGIELNKPNRSALLFLLALVTIYFLAAFVIYAASDYMTRREALRAAYRREKEDERFRTVAEAMGTSESYIRRVYSEDPGTLSRTTREVIEGSQDIDALRQELEGPNSPHVIPTTSDTLTPTQVLWIAFTRIFFEFLLPIVVGLYAIYSLLAQSRLWMVPVRFLLG